MNTSEQPKFEKIPNFNPELTPDSKHKRKKQEMPLKEKLERLKKRDDARQKEIDTMLQSAEGTKARINQIRQELGLPTSEEDPPSVSTDRKIIEKLQDEQSASESEIHPAAEKKSEILFKGARQKAMEARKMIPIDFNTGHSPKERNQKKEESYRAYQDAWKATQEETKAFTDTGKGWKKDAEVAAKRVAEKKKNAVWGGESLSKKGRPNWERTPGEIPLTAPEMEKKRKEAELLTPDYKTGDIIDVAGKKMKIKGFTQPKGHPGSAYIFEDLSEKKQKRTGREKPDTAEKKYKDEARATTEQPPKQSGRTEEEIEMMRKRVEKLMPSKEPRLSAKEAPRQEKRQGESKVENPLEKLFNSAETDRTLSSTEVLYTPEKGAAAIVEVLKQLYPDSKRFAARVKALVRDYNSAIDEAKRLNPDKDEYSQEAKGTNTFIENMPQFERQAIEKFLDENSEKVGGDKKGSGGYMKFSPSWVLPHFINFIERLKK